MQRKSNNVYSSEQSQAISAKENQGYQIDGQISQFNKLKISGKMGPY